jgi:diguanylate cyclase (GGDEF)-like protein
MLAKIRPWFLEQPVWLSVACVVLCSVGGSVGAMFALGSVIGLPSEQMLGRSLAIASTVPALVSLPVSLVIIRLLREVDVARQSAQQLAWNDDLTGLLNRRRFGELVQRELTGAVRTGQPLAVLLLDLDDFKQINDRHGHSAGDAMLRAVATAITACLRATDLSGRWGGEEFAVALPHANLEQAVVVSQRVREQISKLRVHTDAAKLLSCTASIGVAAYRGIDEPLESLLNRADRAMYRAKQSGKNRVMMEDAA